MEGSGEQAFGDILPEDGSEPLFHLRTGFIGECQGEDGFGRDVVVANQVGDAVGDGTGLAGSSAGEDQDGPVDGIDGFLLVRIEGHGERTIRW